MLDPEYVLNAQRREVVLSAVKEVCNFRGWVLAAAHVRTDHVHVVVSAAEKPEVVMRDFKIYASKRLNQVEENRRRWARHGSTRHLWNSESIRAAIKYVAEQQGEPMALYVGPSAH
jgi:REP element-mobilizing transposase RayT